jgi:predicted transcriptional regulator
MTRTEAIAAITSSLAVLPDDRLELLAQVVADWSRDVEDEDDVTRAAVAEGLAQAHRGDFASEEEVEAAFARFRK